MNPPAITRFAPSPTGHLHIGGARTALYNWALARSLGGRFLLRIEDTDRARSSGEAVAGILEDLAWLGLEWDEGPELTLSDGRRLGGDPRGVGPFFQAQCAARYDAAIRRLLDADLAYPAFEAPEELERLRAEARSARRNFRYRRNPDYDREAARARMAAGEPHVIRFRMPEEEVVVQDEILGEVRFAPDQLDDFVIRKRDGFPTYHLAVVVDDEAMGVTHVLRGQEHLNNTPRHVSLQQALGNRHPIYAHLPVIQNADGSKMSKRDKDKAARRAIKEALARDPEALRARIGSAIDPARLEGWLADPKSQLGAEELRALERVLGLELPGIDVEDFRRAGYLPEVLVNFLALLGWSPGDKDAEGRDLERFDLGFLAERFGLDRIGRGNSRFDRAKLLAFNQETLGAMSDAEFHERWVSWASRYAPEARARLAGPRGVLFTAAMKSRCRTLADATAPDGPGSFALVHDEGYVFEEKAVQRFLRKGEPPGIELLRRFREELARTTPFEPGPLEAAASSFAEAQGVGFGRIAQALRVALTGRAASPPLGETLAILGREAVLARVDRCLADCGG